jgi:Rrf2 family transcriptional regulator, nitric oxide-sensitive transcriptional repressor
MRLTLHTDYALRVLIQAALNGDELTTINDVAESFGISKQHLMKVVNDLSQKGYLDTIRGRNGGIRLMRKPRDINIGQVVRDSEDRLDVIGCLSQAGYCRIERACVLRTALRKATDAFLAVLDGYTLADLIKPHKALSSLLFDGPVAARAS